MHNKTSHLRALFVEGLGTGFFVRQQKHMERRQKVVCGVCVCVCVVCVCVWCCVWVVCV